MTNTLTDGVIRRNGMNLEFNGDLVLITDLVDGSQWGVEIHDGHLRLLGPAHFQNPDD